MSISIATDGLVSGAGSADSTPPQVLNLSPAPGTAITSQTFLEFDVTEDGGTFKELMVIASFPGMGLLEVIYMDGGFSQNYARHSARTVIANGFHFSVLRELGWPASPTIVVKALDLSGNEA